MLINIKKRVIIINIVIFLLLNICWNQTCDDGFILIGDKNILSTICTNLTKGNNLSAALTAAVFIEVEKQGICMIGKKK